MPAVLQRRKLYARIQNLSLRQAPVFDSWSELWTAAASIFGRQRHILVVDELPYVAVTNLTDGVVTLCLRMEGYWYAPPNSHTLQLV